MYIVSSAAPHNPSCYAKLKSARFFDAYACNYPRAERMRRSAGIPVPGCHAAEMRVLEAKNLPGPLDTGELVLYTHTLCPYAQRVWLALLEKVYMRNDAFKVVMHVVKLENQSYVPRFDDWAFGNAGRGLLLGTRGSC
jgi:hypothetical protein